MNKQATIQKPPAGSAKMSERLLTAPILPTLLKLSAPTTVAMLAIALVAIAETAYVGVLGVDALAAMALTFPMIMLMQMVSAGAMGGGVSSAIARAVGAGDLARANTLALHAIIIAVVAAAIFSAFFWLLGPAIYRLLGGQGKALDLAILYSHTVFSGALCIWLFNTLSSVLRGTGNMNAPSVVALVASALQIAIGGVLGLGLGPVPSFGVIGIGLGQVIAFGLGSIYLFIHLCRPDARLRLSLTGFQTDRAMFADILRVGALASLSSLQTVLTVLIFTGLVARFGTVALAGYGIGARLEFLLVPIAFSVGVASVPMVGMAIGAKDILRARKVAWTAGSVAAAGLGLVGLVVVVAPDLWSGLFTSDEAVIAAARQYLTAAGFGFPFFGFGLCLYFASQGAGKVLGPVLGGTIRLVIVAAGGWWLATSAAPVWTLFALAGGAMIVYGIATGLMVKATRWD
jgi:putative MATE family efflux protein